MGRGFTGHEHLPWFNLVNMNGRLYDPVVGRMLSADPYVQMPDNTQSFNRYAYCLNNPLVYADPTGYSMIGDFFRWVKESADNFGAWLTQNNIQFRAGYSTTTDNFLGGIAYIGTPSNGTTNEYVGYNIKSGKLGLGNDLGGFTNFWFRKQNNTSAEQIVDNAVAEARMRGTLQDNIDEAYSIGIWYNANMGISRDEIINQRKDRSWTLMNSQPGGPSIRYVKDPLSNSIIDLRHMLVIGERGEAFGNFVEEYQYYLGQPSGRNIQDYFSSELGRAYYNSTYGQMIINRPNSLKYFLQDPAYKYIRTKY